MQGAHDPQISNFSGGNTTCTSSTHQGADSTESAAEALNPHLLFKDIWAKRLQLEMRSSEIQEKLYARQWDAVEELAAALVNELQGMCPCHA